MVWFAKLFWPSINMYIYQSIENSYHWKILVLKDKATVMHDTDTIIFCWLQIASVRQKKTFSGSEKHLSDYKQKNFSFFQSSCNVEMLISPRMLLVVGATDNTGYAHISVTPDISITVIQKMHVIVLVYIFQWFLPQADLLLTMHLIIYHGINYGHVLNNPSTLLWIDMLVDQEYGFVFNCISHWNLMKFLVWCSLIV